jgi:hypothetical protein
MTARYSGDTGPLRADPVCEPSERRVTLGTGALSLPHPNKSTPQKSRKHEQHNEDQVST